MDSISGLNSWQTFERLTMMGTSCSLTGFSLQFNAFAAKDDYHIIITT
jgi:hypothetical protein